MKGPTRLAVIAALVFIGRSELALADGDVVLQDFTGDKKIALHDQVKDVLEKAGVSLAEDGPSGDDAAVLSKYAKRHGVRAFVTGNTTMKKSGWTLVLTVRGSDGAVVGTTTLKGPWLPGLQKNIDKEGPDKLSALIEKTSPAKAEPEEEAEEEPAAEEEPKEEQQAEEEPEKEEPEKDEEPSKGDENRPSPLDLSVAMGLISRSYFYNQDVNQNLRTHDTLMPSVYVALGWYPGAHFASGVAAAFGIVGDFETGFASSSRLESDSNTTFKNSLLAFSAGARGRLNLGRQELGLSFKGGRHAFGIEDDADPGSLPPTGSAPLARDYIPDVAYGYLAPGLDARFAIGPVFIWLHGEYRIVLGLGDLESDVWFPRASSTGAIDGGARLGYMLPANLYVFGGFDYRRFGIAMNSKPSDTGAGTPGDPTDDRDVAGGATDRYVTGRLGIGWRLGAEK